MAISPTAIDASSHPSGRDTGAVPSGSELVGVDGVDVDAARAATPGCSREAFLLSAGSSLPTAATLDAVIGHLRLESDIGGYAAADRIRDVLEHGRGDLAALVGGRADEVAFQPSDSVAWVKAWLGWVFGGNVAAGSVVLVDRMVYHSHYAVLDQTRAIAGFAIEVLASLPDGTVDLEQVVIADSVAAVCITFVGTHSGNVNPVGAVGERCRAVGVPMFVDACQAVGQIEIDVRQLGCSVLTATGRKYLRGPRGTGLLWVANELIDRFRPPGLDGVNTSWTSSGMHISSGVRRFEEYEVPYAAMVGLCTAAGQAREIGIPAIERRVGALAGRLRAALSDVEGVVVRDTAARLCGIVTFTTSAADPHEVVAAAARAGVVINMSSAVWAALDMEAKATPTVVRASPHYFNTTDETDRLIELVASLNAR